jgi:hypothetical protein
MSSQPRVVQTNSLPLNTVKPFPAGSNSVYTAGVVDQKNQNLSQNSLVGNKQSGGTKRKSCIRGGQPPVVQVTTAPSYAVNKTDTNNINAQITGLAVSAQNNAAFDGTVNTNQANVAEINANQNKTFYGSGGSRRRKRRVSYKKGGSWPVWGCLSGGNKSRRYKKKCMCKRRKTHKHMKRHRR